MLFNRRILKKFERLINTISNKKVISSIENKKIPPMLKEYVLRNIDVNKYKSIVFFDLLLPFAISPLLVKSFLINPQVERGRMKKVIFDIVFLGELESYSYLSKVGGFDKKFSKKGTRISIIAFTEFFDEAKIDNNVLLLLDKIVFYRLNQFLMTYISRTNDLNVSLASNNIMNFTTYYYLYDSGLNHVTKILSCIKSPPLLSSELVDFNAFEDIAQVAYKEDLANSYELTFYKRSNAWKLFEDSYFSESVMGGISFAEEFLCKTIIKLSSDCDIEKIYRKNLSSLLEKELPELYSIDPFRKKTLKNDSNKDIYNFFHYGYTLRNKVAHGRYVPTELECLISLKVTDNFIIFLQRRSTKELKEELNNYAVQFKNHINIEEDIALLSELYPDLYYTT